MSGKDAPTTTLALQSARSKLATVLGGLSQQQKLYTEARMSGMTPLASARAAGVGSPEVNAYRLEKHPKVREAMRAAQTIAAERIELGRDDIVQGFMDAVNSAGTAMELVAAWREIGKMVGAYEPVKVDVRHSIDDMTLNKLQRMSEDELLELAGQDDFRLPADDALAGEFEVVKEAITEDMDVRPNTPED